MGSENAIGTAGSRSLPSSTFTMSIAVVGSYIGIPCSVVVDSSLPVSTVSSRFVALHGCPQTITTQGALALASASGPVVLFTPNGWYESSFCLDVAYVPH